MSSQASPARKESSKIEQVVLEMSSPLLSSSSGGFFSVNEDPSTRKQAVISPYHPNQSHAHTPPFKDTSTAASLQDKHIGVNENTPPIDLASLKGDLYIYALKNNWERAKSIFHEFPHMIPMELTVNGDTALHVAARSNNITFAQELVNLNLMTPKDLEIKNSDGNTAFCIAAIFGNGDLFRTMIEKNKNLPQIRGHDEMLPIHLAALNGHRQTVQDLLTDEDQLKKMADNDLGRLFLMTISSGLYDVATKLLEKYPASLVTAKDDQEQTALHMLARKPSQEFDMEDDNNEEASSGLREKSQLLQELSYHVRRLKYKTALDLTTKPSKVLFEAVKSGNIHTVKWLLYTIPALLEQKEPNGQNVLHIAALHRQLSIFEFILKTGTANLLIWEVDNDRNNVLHLAAHWSDKISTNVRPSILLARELRWFEEVKKRVPPELRTMRNSKGETPKDKFSADHEMLLKQAKETAKGIANPCMLVATLIATVVFPAALTVPGDDRTNPEFMPFIFANAAALFTACASIIIFLTIYTSSWFTENESFISLHGRLTLGLGLLVASVYLMIVALVLSSNMIFLHKYWAPHAVLALSFPSVTALLYLLYAPLFNALKALKDRVDQGSEMKFLWIEGKKRE